MDDTVKYEDGGDNGVGDATKRTRRTREQVEALRLEILKVMHALSQQGKMCVTSADLETLVLGADFPTITDYLTKLAKERKVFVRGREGLWNLYSLQPPPTIHQEISETEHAIENIEIPVVSKHLGSKVPHRRTVEEVKRDLETARKTLEVEEGLVLSWREAVEDLEQELSALQATDRARLAELQAEMAEIEKRLGIGGEVE